MFLFLCGCVDVSETQKLMVSSAEKSNSLQKYSVEYERVVINYLNPEEQVYMIPASKITKYRKHDRMMWEVIDWLNNTERRYSVSGEYSLCAFNDGWSCKTTDESSMKEFLGYDVSDADSSIRRQISNGAILLGEIEGDTILGRDARCFALEIHPEKFVQADWNEYVLGSMGNEPADKMDNLTVWQCLDSETGVKLELILNYKTEIDGEMRTVEANLKATEFTPNAEIEDSVFELPN